MSDNRNDALTSFLLGAAIGAGVALLLAPEAGPDMRNRIKDVANRFGGDLGEKLGGVKDEIKQRAGDVKSAIGAGRDAYARARTGDEPAPTSNVI
jgi:gas vesicle protein